MTTGAISVIVPTIGRPDSLTLLLESLASQSRRPDEVIVADGGTGDEVRRVVEQPTWASRGLSVRRIAVQPPNAVSQRMAAIAASRGEFLLLLDDDVVLEPDCVEQLAAALTNDARSVGAFADFNNQSWPQPTRAWRFYMRYLLGMAEGSWQGKVVGPLLRFGYDPVPRQVSPIEWLGTCNTMIRRSAYDRAGGFSDFFLHRCTINEDVDLGLKMSRVGVIVFCPAARMGHFHAPGGRVSPAVAAEDDLYNRYLVMRRTQARSAPAAFALVALYFVIETSSNLGGAVLRLRGGGFGARLGGRLRALTRILTLPFAGSGPR
jgi:GT2 family glycosyltransferase